MTDLPEKRSGKTDQLSLSHRQVLPSLRHLVLQPLLKGRDKLVEVTLSQGRPHGLVVVLLERVKVSPQCAAEEHGVLMSEVLKLF